jgi:macrolide transport system ATP-binding/permease protein
MGVARWWSKAPLRLRSLLRGKRVERELAEELQFHLESKIEEGIAAGLSPQEARFAALRAMGGLEQRKEEIRDTRGIHWLTDLVADARYAVRSLRRAPALTGFVVLTLALGIGMTSATFSMVDALIFRPYPVPHPRNVVTLVSTSRDSGFEPFSYREYLDIRRSTHSYDGVLANANMQAVGFSVASGATPRVKSGMLVSGNYFAVLGVEPRVGRTFREDEDAAPDRDAVVVLGPDVWKTEFASDPAVVGRIVRLNGTDFTVIGVAPDSFPGMLIFSRPDFYMPLAMARVFSTNPQKNLLEDRDARELSVKARLKPGTSVADAESELSVVAQVFARDYPHLNRERGAGVRTQFDMRTRDDDVNWKFSAIFTALALAVLLVACTNVAGLLLSRARTRTREIAVRLAIGAGRYRLVRLLLAESLVLALLGGLAGIAVGYSVIRILGSFKIPTELPTIIPFRMDTRVLFACLVLSLLCALLSGLAPALQSTRADLVNGLKTADADLPGRKRLWGRSMLVVAQVATSLMLLTASFLMVRSFRESFASGTGFAKDHLLLARFDPRLVQYDEAQTERFYKLLIERMRAAPGVRSAALARGVPLGLDGFDRIAFAPDGFTMPRDRATFTAMSDTVDQGYFETMGIPLLRGRSFDTRDSAGAPLVAVVNEQFAHHYWPNQDALGKRIRLDGATGPQVEVVGIAQTVKYQDTGEKPKDFVYRPFAQAPAARMLMLIRSSGEPLQLVGALKEVVRSLDANLPIVETRTYEDLYKYHTVDGPQFAINLVMAMGAVGLLLAIAGLYGLVSYNVTRRTREIGIRLAIGAEPRDVLRLMMGRGLTLVAIGTALGLVMGFGVERLMNAALFNAGGVDIVAYLVVVPSMFLVTMLAAYVPARRAAQIAPTQALRYE